MIFGTTIAMLIKAAILKFWFGVLIGITGGIAYFRPDVLRQR